MQFDAPYIDMELGKIGTRIRKPISVYLIGGCAMSFRNLKESTKTSTSFSGANPTMMHSAMPCSVQNTMRH